MCIDICLFDVCAKWFQLAEPVECVRCFLGIFHSMSKMDMEELFQKHNIRRLQVNLQIENFDKYRQSQPISKIKRPISSDHCKILLSSAEVEKILETQENKKRQNEIDESKQKSYSMHRYKNY